MKKIDSLHELQNEAISLLHALKKNPAGATLITLSGELGAGKTALTQALARALLVEEPVTSPTFVLEKIYTLPEGQPFKRLVHIDAYRLEQGSDLAPLGFDALLADPDALIVLEWPERVADALPAPQVEVALAALPDGSHTISYGD